jgi:uncharacterized damage-inducible protein DinB
MNIPEAYDYLVRARRDLWTRLKAVPDEVLSRPLLDGAQFHCIKDLVFHIPSVEDAWIHEDILREEPVRETMPAFKDSQGGPVFAAFALEALLDFWRRVEHSTLTYLPTLSDGDLKRIVTAHDAPDERFTVDSLLWHIMIHEIRHTAQIAVLLRTQGIKPPSLDLLFYLPSA